MAGALASLKSGEGLHWTDKATIVSDPPEKAESDQDNGWLLGEILPVITAARKSIEITSPYFIPQDSGARLMLQLAGAGVSISVLTNSLAATDVTAVHGAYMRFAGRCLPAACGSSNCAPARPTRTSRCSARAAPACTPRPSSSTACRVSSAPFNFDPRSISLNTEMGLLFEHVGLAREMQAVFAEETETRRSYRLVLAGDPSGWQDAGGRILDQEPDASVRRRAMASAISLLPVESQL